MLEQLSIHVYLFVICLFNWSLCVETHIGPDGAVARLEQNTQAGQNSLYKHAGRLVYGNVKKRNKFEIMRWKN